jgi:hypothetical protein
MDAMEIGCLARLVKVDDGSGEVREGSVVYLSVEWTRWK